MAEEMEIAYIRLPRSLYEWLVAEARRQGDRSLSSLIRQVLQVYRESAETGGK